MNFSRSQLIILGVIAAVVLFFILVLLGIFPGSKMREPRINIIFWGVTDEVGVFEQSFNEYKKNAPSVSVEYRRFSLETYEKNLIDALAAGEGPDIFMFHSSWLPKHGNKVVPAPTNKISAAVVSRLFPQVVEQDFVWENRVYALPLAVDTLALYYNRDILDRRGVALPPKTWLEFQQAIVNRGLSSSFGGTSTIMKSTDLLSLLFLQSGARLPSLLDRTISLTNDAGLSALNFYTRFFAPEEQAIDAFSGQRTSLMFDYAAARPILKTKSPFLDFSVSEIPQSNLEEPISFASYYGLAVAKKANTTSLKQERAWDLILFLTTDESAAESYLRASNRPPALRSLINKYLDHPELGVFARQALIARSVLNSNQEAVNLIFDKLIKATQERILAPFEALRQAESELSSVLILR